MVIRPLLFLENSVFFFSIHGDRYFFLWIDIQKRIKKTCALGATFCACSFRLSWCPHYHSFLTDLRLRRQSTSTRVTLWMRAHIRPHERLRARALPALIYVLYGECAACFHLYFVHFVLAEVLLVFYRFGRLRLWLADFGCAGRVHVIVCVCVFGWRYIALQMCVYCTTRSRAKQYFNSPRAVDDGGGIRQKAFSLLGREAASARKHMEKSAICIWALRLCVTAVSCICGCLGSLRVWAAHLYRAGQICHDIAQITDIRGGLKADICEHIAHHNYVQYTCEFITWHLQSDLWLTKVSLYWSFDRIFCSWIRSQMSS